MSDRIVKQQELKELIIKNTDRDGVHTTSIPSLFLIRESTITEPISRVNNPSVCLIVQGEKEVWLGEESLRYSPGHYIVSSVALPVTGQVIKASSDSPYLAFKIEFTTKEILDILKEEVVQLQQKKRVRRGMYDSKAEASILDAAIRLARLLEKPQHIPVLAPLVKKEILYWVLQGPKGDLLQQIALEGSHIIRIKKVIEFILENFEKSFRIEDLANIANMSPATFHRHFKEVTAMSPIQFQKKLRLQEARRLLLAEPLDVASVAFQVGYESPSQFSREYTRMFGNPPTKDIQLLKRNILIDESFSK